MSERHDFFIDIHGISNEWTDLDGAIQELAYQIAEVADDHERVVYMLQTLARRSFEQGGRAVAVELTAQQIQAGMKPQIYFTEPDLGAEG